MKDYDTTTESLPPMKSTGALLLVIFFGANFTAAFATEFEPAPLHSTRSAHQAQLIENQLYVFGGYGGDGADVNSLQATWRLELKTKKWTRLASMKQSKSHFSSAAVRGNIYAIGGPPREGVLGCIERYDPKTNTWKIVLQSKDLPKTHHSAAAVGDLIYIIGGFPSNNHHLHMFNTRTNKLSQAPKLPGFNKGDHFHHMVALDGKLHVLGAMRFEPDSGLLDQHWMLDGDKWKKKAPLPMPSMSKFSNYGVIDKKIYLFNTIDDLHHIYDLKSNTWSDSAKQIPVGLGMSPTVVSDRQLHAIGGDRYKKGSPSKASVLTYDARKNTWHEAK